MQCSTDYFQTSRPDSQIYLVKFLKFQKSVLSKHRAALSGQQLQTTRTHKLLGKCHQILTQASLRSLLQLCYSQDSQTPLLSKPNPRNTTNCPEGLILLKLIIYLCAKLTF
jgi:hypothetical protein